MRKLCWGLLLCLGTALPALGEVHWFEDVLPGVAEPWADPTAARFVADFLGTAGAARMFQLTLGSNVGILQPTDRTWSLEGRAAMFARFDFLSPSFEFQTADFIGGLTWRCQWAGGETEVYGFHHSAHTGDDVTAVGVPVENISREVLRMLTWYRGEAFSAYAGPRILVISDPLWMQGKVGAQAGLQWQAGRVSLALDLLLHGEYRGDTDVTFTAGFNLSPPATRWQQVFQIFAACGHPRPGQLEGGYANSAGCGMVVRDQGPTIPATQP
ncbi:MAG: hypothetical protein HGA76_06660 [Candidatus Firestonebacteria bacterium]|nr:hypothetical protein [Candidatus Firestonebacteria bacterium]